MTELCRTTNGGLRLSCAASYVLASHDRTDFRTDCIIEMLRYPKSATAHLHLLLKVERVRVEQLGAPTWGAGRAVGSKSY